MYFSGRVVTTPLPRNFDGLPYPWEGNMIILQRNPEWMGEDWLNPDFCLVNLCVSGGTPLNKPLINFCVFLLKSRMLFLSPCDSILIFLF